MQKEDKNDIDPEILKEMLAAVRKIKFGEVVITVYDSKIVQIEKREKKRFN